MESIQQAADASSQVFLLIDVHPLRARPCPREVTGNVRINGTPGLRLPFLMDHPVE
jgi:hypothetical protein